MAAKLKKGPSAIMVRPIKEDGMGESLAMGWLPDLPDIRDYHPAHTVIKDAFSRLGPKARPQAEGSVDLRGWCPPIEDQKTIGSCTANAGVGMYEYFEKRAAGKHTDASRLFLYKVTRNLLGWTGDTGASLRTTMGALVLFGTPPERFWPYNPADFDKEPSAFCYSFARNYAALQYYRLDPAGTTAADFLKNIKSYLASGYVSIIGFTVYNSISQAASSGEIPFPVTTDRVVGGHAMVLVGYDDGRKIKNANPGGVETTGAFLIRNSWGIGWGKTGYGWLPYEYVAKGLAEDCWTMIKGEWIDSGQFGIP
jgi:C1A family cysteine protease